MPDNPYPAGTRVTFTVDNLGAIDPSTPYRFTARHYNTGDLGTVIGRIAVGDSWIAVRPDTEPEWSEVYVPVHPSMIALAENE